MSTGLNCTACEDLKDTSSDFVVNGLSDAMCTSLANNTGLSTSDSHDDCDDLNDMNDCLVGTMAKEVDSYQTCDWKEFTKNFIKNLWVTLKAMICTICGIWKKIKYLQCQIDYLFNGASFYFGETPEAGKESILIPGKGVDFTIRSSSDEHANDVRVLYVAGGLARIGGSLRLFTESFKDASGNTKSGNSIWDFSSPDMPKGGELLYEVRIKKSEYPQIKQFYNGNLWPTGGNDKFCQSFAHCFTGGEYAYGQHGWCNSDGTPSENDYSNGHLVPAGWIYLQVRMMYAGTMTTYNVTDGAGSTKRGTDVTPQGYIGIRMNQSEISC